MIPGLNALGTSICVLFCYPVSIAITSAILSMPIISNFILVSWLLLIFHRSKKLIIIINLKGKLVRTICETRVKGI